MLGRMLLGFCLVACSAEPPPSTPIEYPSADVRDCTQGCEKVPLTEPGSDVSVAVGPDTVVLLELAPELCARVSSSPGSQALFHAQDSGYAISACQVFDNEGAYGRARVIVAEAAQVRDAWVRVETGCQLSCAR